MVKHMRDIELMVKHMREIGLIRGKRNMAGGQRIWKNDIYYSSSGMEPQAVSGSIIISAINILLL